MKENKYFNEIMEGLNDILDHEKGNKKLKTKHIKVTPVEIMTAKEVTKLRESLLLSQSVFAELLGVSKKTVEAWEYGKNSPSCSSLRILNLIESNPDFIYKYKLLSTS
jgi:putative transcriptional regulator